MLKIKVERQLGSYPIFIGYDLLSKAKDIFQFYKFTGKILLISTPELEAQHRRYLQDILGAYRGKVYIKYFTQPKTFLNLNTVQELLSFLVDKKFDKDSAIISFGGSSLHDIAGFTARLFLNGIAFVPIPTSLPAQLDAAIKPRVWLNHDGCFSQISNQYLPTFGWIDTCFLKKMTRECLSAGFIEAIRIATIWDSSLFEFIDENLPALYRLDVKSMLFLIHKINSIKSDILSKFRERTSAAKYLNFGKIIHTVLLRHKEKWEITSLEAAYLGPFIESVLACRMGVLPVDEYQRLEALFLRLGIKVRIGKINFDTLSQMVRQHETHYEQFAFPKKIGEGVLINCSEV